MRLFSTIPLSSCIAGMLMTALLGLGGCGAKAPGWASLNPNDWSVKRQADEPLVLQLEGPISLDIDTFAGDVVIDADPKYATGEVVIVREGRHGHGRSDDSEASLADINVSAEMVAADTSRGELGQTLRVRATSTGPEPHLQKAHVHIKAPAVEGLTVRTHDGDVTATHVEGMIDIESSRGTVSVRTNLRLLQPVTILNSDGDIIFRMGPGSAGSIDAQTIDGHAQADIQYGDVRVDGAISSDIFKATLNNGPNRMTFRTTYGDIKIAVLTENEKTLLLQPKRKPREEPPLVKPAATQPE